MPQWRLLFLNGESGGVRTLVYPLGRSEGSSHKSYIHQKKLLLEQNRGESGGVRTLDTGLKRPVL